MGQVYPPYAGETNDLRPTADASSHFAYSTTLRRHHVPHHHLSIPQPISGLNTDGHHHPQYPLLSGRGAREEVEYAGKVVRSVGEGLWERAVRYVVGATGRGEGYSPLGSSAGTGTGTGGREEETASAKFAHLTVEVRFPSPPTDPLLTSSHLP
jgi:hypothetical protein